MSRVLYASYLVLASAFAASVSQAVPVLPGDLLVAIDGMNAVVRADLPSSETIISQGGDLVRPREIAIGEDGRIFVVGGRTGGSGTRVSEIDPMTGSVRVVTEYQGISDGCVIEDGGSLLCTKYSAGNQVLRIDPDTGSLSTVTSGGNLVGPAGIVLDDLGDIYLTDSDGGLGPGQTVHVNHVLGTQTVVSSGGMLSGELRELVFDANGDLLVVDAFDDSIVRIDTATGAQSLVASGFIDLAEIGLDPTGRLLGA